MVDMEYRGVEGYQMERDESLDIVDRYANWPHIVRSLFAYSANIILA